MNPVKCEPKKILRHLRLIFILFMNIFFYLKVLKKYIQWLMKLNTKCQEKTSLLEVKLFNFMRYKLEFIYIKTW